MKLDYEINLNVSLKDLDGREIEGSDLGKFVANLLASSNKGDALKWYSWAQKLFNGDKLVLDASDYEVFVRFIKDNDQLTVISKAQILLAIQQ